MRMARRILAKSISLALAVATLPAAAAPPAIPAAIAVTDQNLITTIQAQGAQIYECKFDASGRLAWQFREPIATLFRDGKTIGRHFAGPSWELADGSAVTGKLAARADGATVTDIPLLKLDVVSRRELGVLSATATIQRLNTHGGTAEGPCPTAGAFLSVPYSADYAFYGKRNQPTESFPSAARPSPNVNN
jgi:hypothetical protein